MRNKDTKIQYLVLLKRLYRESRNDSFTDLSFKESIEHFSKIVLLSKRERSFDLKDDKFCFLDTFEILDDIGLGCFKSARNEFRPNLLNRRTLSERRNPKEKVEGDIEKTHFVIKNDFETNETLLLLEYNHFGLTINNFINYLQNFSKKNDNKDGFSTRYKVIYSFIPKNNFLTELENFERAKIAEIYIDKQLLGNEALEFSQRIFEIKQDVKLVVKADTRSSITNFGVDLFNSFKGKKDKGINRIRIKGIDKNGNETFVDTSFMGKQDFVDTIRNNETGESESNDLLNKMKAILENF
uniref:hypothetical protein n=1 Tax=Chryseobacterium gambrini TaxID=373672 RepID=UPI003D13E020